MSSSYDAIVIGAGLGGLTSGALLATAGWRVLIAEAGPAAGGYAHAFIRNGYTFDPAIHMVPEPPFIKNLLAHVGAEIDLRPVESLFAARFPELTLEVGHTPHDVEVFLAPFVRAFPARNATCARSTASSRTSSTRPPGCRSGCSARTSTRRSTRTCCASARPTCRRCSTAT